MFKWFIFDRFPLGTTELQLNSVECVFQCTRHSHEYAASLKSPYLERLCIDCSGKGTTYFYRQDWLIFQKVNKTSNQYYG